VPSEEDQTTITGNMYRKFEEIWTGGFWDMWVDRQTDRQTDRQNVQMHIAAHRDTSPNLIPAGGEINMELHPVALGAYVSSVQSRRHLFTARGP